VRCCWVELPYTKAPKLMVDENIVDMVGWLNAFPHKEGISQTLSPATIVLGNPKPDCKQLRATFGAYCEVFVRTTRMNAQRSVSGIALRASNNRGGYYFMSLESGRRIHSFMWRELPIFDYVIGRVQELAESEDAPSLDEDRCPIFEWLPGTPIDDGVPNEGLHFTGNDDEYEYDTEDDESVQAENEEAYDSADNEDYDPADNEASVQSDGTKEEFDNTLVDTSNHSEEIEVEEDEPEFEPIESEDDAQEESVKEPQSDAEQEIRSNEEPEIRRKERPTRVRQPTQSYEPTFDGKTYEASMFNIKKGSGFRTRRELARMAVNVMFNQMTATKVIKMFGERDVAAMIKEYQQLNDMKVIRRTDPNKLTSDQKRRALRAINLIKHKRCGKVKGRAVADRSPTRAYVPREEATSLTASLEAQMATLLIDAHEDRDVAIFDIPGAYLHAHLPDGKFVLLKIEGQFVDIMCEVNPEFLPDVRYENGKKVLYVQILKALYGMIESALLWYSLYVDVLEKDGFKLNPYGTCVANKMVDGKQCTVVWYVDDNKLSHKDSKVVDTVLGMVEERFPGLVIERGKSLNFLGMEINFIGDKKVKVGVKKDLGGLVEVFEAFDGVLTTKVSSPAAKWLMTVDENARKLSVENRRNSTVWLEDYCGQRREGDLTSKPLYLSCVRE